MKHITLTSATVGILLSSAFAGEYMPSPVVETVSAPVKEALSESLDFSDLPIQPYLNGRLRLESREIVDLADQSTAGTISLSPGLKTKSFGGFSALVEGEFTYAFADDYRSGGQSQLDPFVTGNTAILDPETEELNQAYLQYSGSGFTAKVGRQRIILDKAAFVGNVGWRQNEQTYDAATLSYKGDGYKATVGYIDQVNRIFGSDAIGPVKELTDGEAIFANVSSDIGGAYAYLIDFDQGNFSNSDTFGVYTKYKGIYAEVAYQENDVDEALYGHVKYSQKVAGGMGTVGVEYLGETFRTPLATVHAYNGFADAFATNRLGLNGGLAEGLTDVYASYVKKGLPFGLVFKGFLHAYMDGDFSESLGYEADMVLAKKLSDQMTLVTKFAYFFGDDDAPDYAKYDIEQASVQLDFKF